MLMYQTYFKKFNLSYQIADNIILCVYQQFGVSLDHNFEIQEGNFDISRYEYE